MELQLDETSFDDTVQSITEIAKIKLDTPEETA